jgi:hypothetical protein
MDAILKTLSKSKIAKGYSTETRWGGAAFGDAPDDALDMDDWVGTGVCRMGLSDCVSWEILELSGESRSTPVTKHRAGCSNSNSALA